MAAAVRPGGYAAVPGAERLVGDKKKVIVTYTQYVSTLSRCQMFSRVAAVLTTTGVGAGIGALAGAPAGGIGAGPGAAIGAGVGFVIGVAATATYDYCAFKEFLKGMKSEQQEAFLYKLQEITGNDELICPITRQTIMDPVRIPTTPHLFEREALEKWLSERQTCPMTRSRATVDNIFTDIGAHAVKYKYYQTVLTNLATFPEFDANEQKALALLRKDSEEHMKRFFEKESAHLTALVNKGKLTPREYAREALRLADAMDPPRVSIERRLPPAADVPGPAVAAHARELLPLSRREPAEEKKRD